MEGCQSTAHQLDAGRDLSLPDQEFTFQAVTDGQIWRQRMPLGIRDQMLDASFHARQIAGPAEDAGAPEESDAERHRLSGRQRIDRFVCDADRLIRIAQKPQSSSQYDPRALGMEPKAGGFGKIGFG